TPARWRTGPPPACRLGTLHKRKTPSRVPPPTPGPLRAGADGSSAIDSTTIAGSPAVPAPRGCDASWPVTTTGLPLNGSTELVPDATCIGTYRPSGVARMYWMPPADDDRSFGSPQTTLSVPVNVSASAAPGSPSRMAALPNAHRRIRNICILRMSNGTAGGGATAYTIGWPASVTRKAGPKAGQDDPSVPSDRRLQVIS